MCNQQHIPMTTSELRRGAEYSDNKLALRIIQQYEEEFEERLGKSQNNERTVNDEINEYVVGNLDDLGTYIAQLIVDIRLNKAGVRATTKSANAFKQCAEDNIDTDSYEVLSPMIDKIVRACTKTL
jgi:hypothetical protein